MTPTPHTLSSFIAVAAAVVPVLSLARPAPPRRVGRAVQQSRCPRLSASSPSAPPPRQPYQTFTDRRVQWSRCCHVIPGRAGCIGLGDITWSRAGLGAAVPMLSRDPGQGGIGRSQEMRRGTPYRAAEDGSTGTRDTWCSTLLSRRDGLFHPRTISARCLYVCLSESFGSPCPGLVWDKLVRQVPLSDFIGCHSSRMEEWSTGRVCCDSFFFWGDRFTFLREPLTSDSLTSLTSGNAVLQDGQIKYCAH